MYGDPEKNEYVSCIVPFTPKCGGKHCIVLGAVEGKKTFEFITTVSGRPAVGAKVCRGPDWKYSDHDTATGVVENCEKVDKIAVKWDNGSRFRYNWGEEVGYDVELVNSSPCDLHKFQIFT